ncbi:uncharacterized protein LOC122263442 [Penaeus japonicus]|uniref:uncharacterized protein LOC122263442 n=1 Tax=Penaeus japonicus TaxID=27405 RepID=UPI001C70D298|nr:uncharacterized protein LOC122263442 [Penaeus japonicus]
MVMFARYNLVRQRRYDLLVTLTVEGVEVTFIVDTGCNITVISDQLLKKMGLEDKIFGDEDKFVEVTIDIADIIYTMTVVAEQSTENLLGVDMMRAFNCIIDLKEDTLLFRKFKDVPNVKPYIDCEIAGRATRALVDTGTNSFLSGSMSEAQRLDLPLTDITAKNIRCFLSQTQSIIRVKYQSEGVSVRVFGKEFTGEFDVLPDIYSLIIGMEILEGTRITLPYEGGVVVEPTKIKDSKVRKLHPIHVAQGKRVEASVAPRPETAVVPATPTYEDTFPTLQSNFTSRHHAKSGKSSQPHLQQQM